MPRAGAWKTGLRGKKGKELSNIYRERKKRKEKEKGRRVRGKEMRGKGEGEEEREGEEGRGRETRRAAHKVPDALRHSLS